MIQLAQRLGVYYECGACCGKTSERPQLNGVLVVGRKFKHFIRQENGQGCRGVSAEGLQTIRLVYCKLQPTQVLGVWKALPSYTVGMDASSLNTVLIDANGDAGSKLS